MNARYEVRAERYDYEYGCSTLEYSFDSIERARAFRDRISRHIAYGRHNLPEEGNSDGTHPSNRFLTQGPEEADEAFAARNVAFEARAEAYGEEQMNWFPSGHGYFTSEPRIFLIREEEVQ